MKKKGRPLLQDLAGERFGHLVAVKVDHVKKRQGAYWLCDCTRCGGQAVVQRSNLLNSSPNRSCGCAWGFLTKVSKASGYSMATCSLALRGISQSRPHVVSLIKETAEKIKQSKLKRSA